MQPPHIVQALDNTSCLKRRLEPATLSKKRFRVDLARDSKDSQALNDGIMVDKWVIHVAIRWIMHSNQLPIAI